MIVALFDSEIVYVLVSLLMEIFEEMDASELFETLDVAAAEFKLVGSFIFSFRLFSLVLTNKLLDFNKFLKIIKND